MTVWHLSNHLTSVWYHQYGWWHRTFVLFLLYNKMVSQRHEVAPILEVKKTFWTLKRKTKACLWPDVNSVLNQVFREQLQRLNLDLWWLFIAEHVYNTLMKPAGWFQLLLERTRAVTIIDIKRDACASTFWFFSQLLMFLSMSVVQTQKTCRLSSVNG